MQTLCRCPVRPCAPVRTIEITARINSVHNLAANLISYRNAAVRYAQLTGARALQWQKKPPRAGQKPGTPVKKLWNSNADLTWMCAPLSVRKAIECASVADRVLLLRALSCFRCSGRWIWCHLRCRFFFFFVVIHSVVLRKSASAWYVCYLCYYRHCYFLMMMLQYFSSSSHCGSSLKSVDLHDIRYQVSIET